MEATWQDTANQGRVLLLEEDGLRIFHEDGREANEAVAFWEGQVGLPPSGRFAFWRWKRGLNSLRRRINKAVTAAEGESLSA